MQAAGVNLVSVGIFSWALLEPVPGRFEFGWLDRVLDLLHDGGIAVDLATATASPPPWFSARYPQSLPVNADGRRLWPGSRQAYCPSSPDYRSAAVALAEAIARRYREHPALVLWHVNNEYGWRRTSSTRPSSWTSGGSPPMSCWTVSARNGTCCTGSRRACRSPPISCCPGSRRWTTGPGARTMAADLTRSMAGGMPWLLMEHSTSAVNWQPRSLAKTPGQLRRNSLTHVARGSGRCVVLPVACLRRRSGEVPLRHAAARRDRHQDLARGPRPRRRAALPAGGAGQHRGGRGRAAVGLRVLVGRRTGLPPGGRSFLSRGDARLLRTAVAGRGHDRLRPSAGPISAGIG
jgi:Beta-galactosidase